jgi:hypothetical protein
MRPVAILRELWRFRRAVRLGIVFALVGGLLIAYSVSLDLPPKLESRQYEAGVAAADVLVDSPNSQVVDVGGAPSDVEGAAIDIGGLSMRARLLASLMSSSPLKDRIARAAKIRPDMLIVVAPTGDDLAPRAAPAPTTKVKPGDRHANVMNLYVDETLPIITMRVQAPDAGTAERLASAALPELQDFLKTVASERSIDNARQLVVSPMGPATSATVVKGPSKAAAIFVGILIFGLWCAGTLMIPRVARTWTDAARLEAAQAAKAAAALERDDTSEFDDSTLERWLAPVPDSHEADEQPPESRAS